MEFPRHADVKELLGRWQRSFALHGTSEGRQLALATRGMATHLEGVLDTANQLL